MEDAGNWKLETEDLIYQNKDEKFLEDDLFKRPRK